MPPPVDPTTHADTVALFRYGLIADLLHLPAGDRSLHARLREKADARVRHPRHHAPPRRRRDAARLALRLSPRAASTASSRARARDQGHARALPQAVADQLCALKEAHPTYSVAMIIATARAAAARARRGRRSRRRPCIACSVATGLMARPTDAPTTKDRRRFAFDAANELWMSDVMHGPTRARRRGSPAAQDVPDRAAR